MCIPIYIYIYVYLYIYICVYIYIYMCVCVCASVSLSLSRSLWCVCVCVRVRVCMWACVRVFGFGAVGLGFPDQLPHPPLRTHAPNNSKLGGRIKGTLGDIDPLNKVPSKRARSRVQKGYPLRGLPNTTPR